MVEIWIKFIKSIWNWDCWKVQAKDGCTIYMFTLKVVGKKNNEMRSEAEGVDEKGVSWLPGLKQITRVIVTMSCILTLHTNILCFPQILLNARFLFVVYFGQKNKTSGLKILSLMYLMKRCVPFKLLFFLYK